jgi:hypothetical protein
MERDCAGRILEILEEEDRDYAEALRDGLREAERHQFARDRAQADWMRENHSSRYPELER